MRLNVAESNLWKDDTVKDQTAPQPLDPIVTEYVFTITKDDICSYLCYEPRVRSAALAEDVESSCVSGFLDWHYDIDNMIPR